MVVCELSGSLLFELEEGLDTDEDDAIVDVEFSDFRVLLLRVVDCCGVAAVVLMTEGS